MDARETDDLELKPLYLVRVSTGHGTFSVAYDDARRALKAVGDFHAHGFSDVVVCDAAGQKQDLGAVGRANDGLRPSENH